MVSSIAVMKNDYAEQFEKFASSLNGGGLRQLREEAFELFSANGFPSVKSEDWKYTNVAPFVKDTWTVKNASNGGQDLQKDFRDLAGNFNFNGNGFAALNLAFSDIVCIRIPKETVVERPFELAFSTDEGTARFPHFLVIAEPGSRATIVESYNSTSKSFTNTAIQIAVGDNANITHYRVQRESPEAFHVGTTEVTLGRGSRYDATSINLGAALSRHDIDLKFTAEGGEAFVDGLYMLNGTQHADTHSDHRSSPCRTAPRIRIIRAC